MEKKDIEEENEDIKEGNKDEKIDNSEENNKYNDSNYWEVKNTLPEDLKREVDKKTNIIFNYNIIEVVARCKLLDNIQVCMLFKNIYIILGKSDC